MLLNADPELFENEKMLDVNNHMQGFGWIVCM